MMILEILALVSVGWISGAEMGSWYGIQPVINKFSYEHQLTFQQGMLKTFGKIMPVIMPFSAVVVILLEVFSTNGQAAVMMLRILAAVCVVIAIVCTVAINVPINNQTDKWKLSENFDKWSRMRTRWHFFQGIRSVLYLISFILLAIAGTIQHHP